MITLRLLFKSSCRTSSLYVFDGPLCNATFSCPHFIRRNASTKVNHYTILGLDTNASQEDIRKAFIARSKECHPDLKIENSAENHKQFILVNEAYSILSKPSLRHNYDLTLQTRTREHAISKSHPNENDYYHHPAAFKDLQSVRNEALRNARAAERSAYYGIPGIKKMSNGGIVLVCLSFMLVGCVLYLIASSHLFTTYKRILDENDAKTSLIFQVAKEKASSKLLMDDNLEKTVKQNSSGNITSYPVVISKE